MTPLAPSAHWLAIAEEDFVPTDSGGRVESLNMLRAFAASGVRLRVLIPGLDPASADAHRAALPDVAIEAIPRRTGWRSHASLSPYLFASRPLPAGLLDRIRHDHASDPYDAVVSVSFRVAHLGEALAEGLGIPLVIRPHNFESDYFVETGRSVRFPRRLAYLLESYKLRRAEAAIHASPAVTLFADIGASDAAHRATLTTARVIHVPPFISPPFHLAVAPGTGDRLPGSSNGRTVLFVGSLDSPHNVAGLLWFVEECWPALRLENPGIEFQVVGRRAPSGLVAALSAAGVQVTVDAPRILPHLARADVFVNPIRQGSGVNIKVVEAMAAGLAVVTSSVGARGVPWRDGEHLLVADGPAEFSRAVTDLLRDPDRRATIARAGQLFVREELDPARQVSRIRAILDSDGRAARA